VADIEEKPMHWLWPNRIARGKLHMVAGEPGLSKSVQILPGTKVKPETPKMDVLERALPARMDGG
jgi:hypothetical protein